MSFSRKIHLGLLQSEQGAALLALSGSHRDYWRVEEFRRVSWRQEGIRGEHESREAAEEWLSRRGGTSDGCVCLFPQRLSTAVSSDLPPIHSKEKLSEVVAYQTGQMAGEAHSGVLYDFRPLPPMPGQENPHLVVVAREDALSPWATLCQRAKIRLDALTPDGVALYNALAFLEPKALQTEGLQLVLDWDGDEGAATLLILRLGVLQYLGVLDAPSADPAQLAQQLQNALRNWRLTQSGEARLAMPERLWISGSAALQEDFLNALSSALGIPAEVLGVPRQRFAPSLRDDLPCIQGTCPSAVLTLGAALLAAGRAALPIALLPERIAWQRERLREFPFLALAAILTVAFLAWCFLSKLSTIQIEEERLAHQENLLDQCLEMAPRLHDARLEAQELQKRLLPLAEASLRTHRFAETIRAWEQASPIPRDTTWCIYLADEFSFAENNAAKASSSATSNHSNRRENGTALRNPFPTMGIEKSANGVSKAEDPAEAPPALPSQATPVTAMPLLTRMYAGGILPTSTQARFQAVKEFQGELNRTDLFTNVDDYTDFLSQDFVAQYFTPWSTFLETYRNVLKKDYALFLLQLPFRESPVQIHPSMGTLQSSELP
jgi:hypothetical protein